MDPTTGCLCKDRCGGEDSGGEDMAVKVRPVVLKDAASFRRCWDAVAKERRYIYSYEAPSLPKVRAHLRENLRKKNPILVAVDGERVVGWAVVFRADVPSLSHNGHLAMSLHAEYRGIGLGTELATRILKVSQGKFDSVTCCFFSKNKPARRLSRKMGFALCGREKKFGRLAYGFDDQLIMQKQLRG